MVDTEKLRRAISTFMIASAPTSSTQSGPARVDDINRLRNSIQTVLKVFVDELEKQ